MATGQCIFAHTMKHFSIVFSRLARPSLEYPVLEKMEPAIYFRLLKLV